MSCSCYYILHNANNKQYPPTRIQSSWTWKLNDVQNFYLKLTPCQKANTHTPTVCLAYSLFSHYQWRYFIQTYFYIAASLAISNLSAPILRIVSICSFLRRAKCPVLICSSQLMMWWWIWNGQTLTWGGLIEHMTGQVN